MSAVEPARQLSDGGPFERQARCPHSQQVGPRAAAQPLRFDMSDKVEVRLTVNGRDYAILVEPRKTLVDAIREDCGQTGTHIGCEHGICGACRSEERRVGKDGSCWSCT